jgi:hypothetical protein
MLISFSGIPVSSISTVMDNDLQVIRMTTGGWWMPLRGFCKVPPASYLPNAQIKNAVQCSGYDR